jgi:hypothetical protein
MLENLSIYMDKIEAILGMAVDNIWQSDLRFSVHVSFYLLGEIRSVPYIKDLPHLMEIFRRMVKTRVLAY